MHRDEIHLLIFICSDLVILVTFNSTLQTAEHLVLQIQVWPVLYSNFILILVFEVEWTSRDRDFLGHDIGDQSTQKTVIMRRLHLLPYIISEDHDDCPYRNTGHRRSSHHPAEHICPHRVVIISDAKRGIANQSIYHDCLKHNIT